MKKLTLLNKRIARLQELTDKYQQIFEEVGKLKEFQLKLHINKNNTCKATTKETNKPPSQERWWKILKS